MVASSLHGDQLISQISYICSLLSPDKPVFVSDSETRFLVFDNKVHSTDPNDNPLCALSDILIT